MDDIISPFLLLQEIMDSNEVAAITTFDMRVIHGKIQSFDKHFNMLLKDATI